MGINNTAHTEQNIRLIKDYLNKQSLVQGLVIRQDNHDKQDLIESLAKRQHQAEIHQLVNRLHPSDIANLLEQLPPQQRDIVWQHIDKNHIGSVLLELSDNLRQAVLVTLESDELIRVVSHLDSDEIADLILDLPEHVTEDLLSSLPEHQRLDVETTLRFPEDTVGAWMEYDIPVVRENISLDVVLRYLRKKGSIPDSSGRLIVVDDSGQFKGVLLVGTLLVMNGESLVADVMQTDVSVFHTNDSAEDAAHDFERYELILAPVINSHGKLVGVLRVSSLMDLMNASSQRKFLAQAGVSKDENLFDPFLNSARNRWPWIALNLFIVLIATRVIDHFETTITGMVALAALLPITANIGGNSGNQVVALVIRGLALKQLERKHLPRLFLKEFLVASTNGLMWGSITGILILIFYGNTSLSIVILLSMLFTMIMSAMVGVSVPLLLKKMNQDPVLGSSVIITGFTDTMGFLIFLGLATLVLN